MNAPEKRETQIVPRLIELFFLLCGESLSGPQLLQRLEGWYAEGASGERMFQRDIRQLRDLGCTITVYQQPVRYVLEAHPFDQYLTSSEQILALTFLTSMIPAAFPVRGVQGLFRRLLSMLDPQQRADAVASDIIRVWTAPVADYSATTALFTPLYTAISSGYQVQFRYTSNKDRPIPEEHRLDPLVFEYRQGHFYLVGYSHTSNILIDYRLDRIDPRSLMQLTLPIIDPHRDLYPFAFRYWLHARIARNGVSERFAHQTIIATHPDGSVEIAAQARAVFYAARGLLHYAHNARAIWPPELITEITWLLDQARARYTDTE